MKCFINFITGSKPSQYKKLGHAGIFRSSIPFSVEDFYKNHLEEGKVGSFFMRKIIIAVSYTHLYVVTWALGHLVTLADPEEYDKKYMKWDMETLPMMPDKMKLVVIRQTSKQYQAVKTQLFRKDIGDIIIATDAGREGELCLLYTSWSTSVGEGIFPLNSRSLTKWTI